MDFNTIIHFFPQQENFHLTATFILISENLFIQFVYTVCIQLCLLFRSNVNIMLFPKRPELKVN